MARFLVRELEPRTWLSWAKLVEKHNGVWGGCWCVAFHDGHGRTTGTAAGNRALKERLVMAGRTHAAVVYDGPDAVGWCQFGPPDEIPGRMSGYGKLDLDMPNWRIPCFFVDRDRRRDGVAKAALEGALKIIAAKGGGTVDGYPISLRGREYGNSFLWGGTESMFEEAGFKRIGRLGTSKVVMRRTVRRRTV